MSKINGSSVLVTGGNGAIGCNLVKRILDYSCNIVVLDDFSQSKLGNITRNRNIRIIKGDITNEKTLKKIFSKNYDYIFHLAARFANELSIKNPIEDLRVNTQGTLQILLHTAKQKPERVIYTSSSSIYGSQQTKFFRETLYPNPSTPYAVSKLSSEHYCNAIHELNDLNYTIVRLSNSFGPYDPPGKFRNVIPNFLQACIRNKNIIITGTGQETRDFTYVDDTVNGILLAATKNAGKNQIFNIGTGKETKIIKIAKLLLEISNSQSKIIFKPRRKFDHILHRSLDISKARKLLRYSPKTRLEKGLQNTYNWFLNR